MTIWTIRTYSGWWFGCHFLFSQKYWESHHPNWRTHIFQRGGWTTNQYLNHVTWQDLDIVELQGQLDWTPPENVSGEVITWPDTGTSLGRWEIQGWYGDDMGIIWGLYRDYMGLYRDCLSRTGKHHEILGLQKRDCTEENFWTIYQPFNVGSGISISGATPSSLDGLRTVEKPWNPYFRNPPISSNDLVQQGNWSFFFESDVFGQILRGKPKVDPYLVGGLVAIFYFPRNIGNLIIPIDELIFFRGVAQPPTRYCILRSWKTREMTWECIKLGCVSMS